MDILSSGAAAVLTVLMLALTALACLLPARLGYSRRAVLVCLLPVIAAFFLRWLCLDHVTYDYTDFLSGWAAFFRENGGFAAIKLPVGNYNAPYLYFLAAISYLPVPDLYLIKLFSTLFDVVLAWGGLRLARIFCGGDSVKPLVAYCLLLLLPTVVLNGAYWAQCDTLYAALLLHGLACALDRRPALSVILLAVAFSFKLQTVFLLPLWCVLWFTRRVNVRQLLLFPAAYFATIAPALLLGKPIGDILGIYLGQTTEYADYLTLNAPSVYALIPYGAQVDTALAARLGILAAFVLVALTLGILFLLRRRVTDLVILMTALLFAIGIPLLLPHMHDRYFFLADVLTLTLACILPARLWLAVLVQIASLGAYHAYLLLRYAFPMAWGAYLLLAALAGCALLLALELRRAPDTP